LQVRTLIAVLAVAVVVALLAASTSASIGRVKAMLRRIDSLEQVLTADGGLVDKRTVLRRIDSLEKRGEQVLTADGGLEDIQPQPADGMFRPPLIYRSAKTKKLYRMLNPVQSSATFDVSESAAHQITEVPELKLGDLVSSQSSANSAAFRF
jgi:hypothetical protein